MPKPDPQATDDLTLTYQHNEGSIRFHAGMVDAKQGVFIDYLNEKGEEVCSIPVSLKQWREANAWITKRKIEGTARVLGHRALKLLSRFRLTR